MPAPHVTPIKVRFNELDPYGHVNHAVYISYFEHARTEALEAIGLPLEKMAEQGVQVVVMDLTAAYKRPAVAGDTLHVETWLSELRRASTRWRQVIRRGDEICVTITLRGGITDNAGKPMRPPAWLFENLAELHVPDPESD